MKKHIILYLFLVIYIPAKAGDIGNFKLKSINNQYVNYTDLKGDKLTVIDFWATWCKPCINSIPELNKIYNEYKDKGVEMIGINVDSPRNSAKVKPFAMSHKIEYSVLLDINQEVLRELNVSAIPTLIIVDSSDNIVFYHQGFNVGDEEIIRNEINKILKNQ